MLAAAADAFHYLPPRAAERAVCPCCGWRGPAFLAQASGRAVAYQSRCPRCDARSRHRGLVLGLEDLVGDLPEGPVLVFAPEGVVLHHLRLWLPEREIETADLSDPDVDHPGADIQDLGLPTGRYALVMCNHVLEHVERDLDAVRSVARVLDARGTALFTIPGDFDGRPTVEHARPDASGHHRHYGLDVVDRFRTAFTDVDVRSLDEGAPPAAHVRAGETAFVCRGPRSASRSGLDV